MVAVVVNRYSRAALDAGVLSSVVVCSEAASVIVQSLADWGGWGPVCCAFNGGSRIGGGAGVLR